MNKRFAFLAEILATGSLSLLAGHSVLAASPPPQDILPPVMSQSMSQTGAPPTTNYPVVEANHPVAETPTPQVPLLPHPIVEPVAHWSIADARALLGYITTIRDEGLKPADYQSDALAVAVDAGEGAALDAQASRSFDWLAEDLRDGRTAFSARLQWFIVDPDQELMPTDTLLTQATTGHDVAEVLAGLDPLHPDYAALKAELATTPVTNQSLRRMLAINMDRWRWLPRDLGQIYILVNVPEFEVHLMRGVQTVRTYRAIVGKPGPTQTPDLEAEVQAVVFNPTWTVPQSIIKRDDLANKLLANPAKASRQGYKVIEHEDGSVTVVQQPGDHNSLGRMKIDMTNPYAIYLHDTPEKYLFNDKVRAFSHGCVRTDHAVELGMTMAMLGANMSVDEAIKLATTIKYVRVPMTRTFPAYIAYFTMGTGDDGKVTHFKDLYDRDPAVLANLASQRELHTTQRISDQQGNVAEDPL